MTPEAPGAQAYFPSAMHRVKDISTSNDNRGSTYHLEVNEHTIILLCLRVRDEFNLQHLRFWKSKPVGGRVGMGWDSPRVFSKVTFIRMFYFVDVV